MDQLYLFIPLIDWVINLICKPVSPAYVCRPRTLSQTPPRWGHFRPPARLCSALPQQTSGIYPMPLGFCCSESCEITKCFLNKKNKKQSKTTKSRSAGNCETVCESCIKPLNFLGTRCSKQLYLKVSEPSITTLLYENYRTLEIYLELYNPRSAMSKTTNM